MKKQLTIGFTITLFSLFLTLAGFATAMESYDPLDQEITITGMVDQEGEAFILKESDGDEYAITGKDLSDMVGKKVKATGELIREKDNNILDVYEVVKLPEEKVVPYLPFEAGYH